MNPAKRAEIFARFENVQPHPRSELLYESPFELLVAVILSAQATDKSVNLATRTLYKLANTPAKMAALGVEGLSPYIARIGLYRAKAKHVIETSRLLMERHSGEVPADRDALEALPGIGRKTAGVILNNAFGQPTIAVDTHVFRVANRTGIAPGKDVSEVERKLLKFVPERYKLNAHHWLILHGRYVCKARRPECWRCLIVDLCEFRAKNRVAPDV
jgi:endonuclease-3